jgi:signal transduction histidine kinase
MTTRATERPPGQGAHAPAEEDRRLEGVIAVCRLAVCAIGMALVRGQDSAPFAAASSVLAVYSAISGVAALILLLDLRAPAVLGLLVHMLDMAYSAALASLADETTALFELILVFPVLSASYRWGLTEALVTGPAIAALLTAGPILASRVWGSPTWTLAPPIVSVAFVARGVLLLVLALALGYPLSVERWRHREARCLSEMMLEARSEHRVSDTVWRVLRRLLLFFRASSATLVLNDRRTGRVFVRTATDRDGAEPPDDAERDGALTREDDLQFEMRAVAGYGTRPRFGRRRLILLGVDAHGDRSGPETIFLSDHPRPLTSFRHAIVVTNELERRWTARLFVFEPRRHGSRIALVQSALRLMSRVAPVLLDHYSVRRLRSRAISAERARIARELHDGPIQSLLAVDMELAVLRRRADSPTLSADLTRFHKIIQGEIVGLRELLENVRAGAGGSEPLQRTLADLVRNFGIYTGIGAQFVDDAPPIILEPHERKELVQIVVEALANVRKHSGAKRMTLRTAIDRGRVMVSVEDSGRGFAFAGTKTGAELRADGMGPRTILERAHTLKGEVAVTSSPGRGCVIEVCVPIVARV